MTVFEEILEDAEHSIKLANVSLAYKTLCEFHRDTEMSEEFEEVLDKLFQQFEKFLGEYIVEQVQHEVWDNDAE